MPSTKASETIHISVDVPDEHSGRLMRFIKGLKGIENLSYQVNGTTRLKNDAPSKMNGSTKREVIVDFLQKNPGQVNLKQIRAVVEGSGHSGVALGSYMTDLVEAKLVHRTGRGVYTTPKALPKPSKKGA